MNTVTLGELLAARDEGMRVPKTKRRPFAIAWRRIKRINLAPARVLMVVIATFALRHTLVLAGCAAFVIAASMMTPIAGWAVAGLALFFLEARRK
jgi:hypothetical protein